ncbi:hypothetical protein TEQG_05641 [Trichophyton equinum CBS 127.97]|uniref:Uncharacterized protein n=1 Tax=Trichophyton equinum (strain ATCC MYA-4606 / CBS 127.97) TaxID=559882 RepID=F2PXM5_TRIEC|nr:hypothetical protein TEQG_05641 [Trichophyton equinum CBS 127.97]
MKAWLIVTDEGREGQLRNMPPDIINRFGSLTWMKTRFHEDSLAFRATYGVLAKAHLGRGVEGYQLRSVATFLSAISKILPIPIYCAISLMTGTEKVSLESDNIYISLKKLVAKDERKEKIMARDGRTAEPRSICFLNKQ